MANLTKASQELFNRTPDECFPSFEALHAHCRAEREESTDVWQPPQLLLPRVSDSRVSLSLESGKEARLNDWSFTQLCRMAGVNRDTINRLTPETASIALRETLPHAEKPIQLLTASETVRSVHGVAYTRLWNADLLDVVKDYAGDFQPPTKGFNGATGLYCGEQDLFCFLIDPHGWIDIGSQEFAPGFFVWNSEVGRRSLGIQSFWFQRICANHIVWDATEVVEFSRKHTANVRDGLNEIRRIVEALIARRDDRREDFAQVMGNAMQASLGSDAEEVMKVLAKHEIPRHLAKGALDIVPKSRNGFTIFAMVDALTRLTQSSRFAGERLEADARVSSLLALAA